MLLRIRVFAFEVEEGLGNACAVQLPDETFAIVDWGTQQPEAFERLFKAIDGRRLTFVAATHAHQDHTLGLERLLDECARRKIAVDRFVYPASTLHKRATCLTRTRLKAKELGIRTSGVTVDDFAGPAGIIPPWLAFGPGWEVRVLSPPASNVSRVEVGALVRDIVPGNETSLVITCRFLDSLSSVLLPGDATAGALTFARDVAAIAGIPLTNQCLLIPHHGARNGVAEWLYEASRGALVVSAPTSSDFHPSREMLTASRSRCLKTGGDIFCTSYAHACRTEFRQTATAEEEHLVSEGRCFGDIVAEVWPSGTWTVESSDAGDLRRQFGFCRH